MPRPTPSSASSVTPAPKVRPAAARVGAGVGVVRVAAIDAGSNAVRLMVADVRKDGRLSVVCEERVVTRLAAGLQRTGKLDPAGRRETAAALVKFVQRARELKADRVRVVGTAAMRDATDGARFAATLSRTLRTPVEIISPEEEGALAFLCLAKRFGLSTTTAACDIGGGSAQVILAVHGQVAKVLSVPLGAVRLTDRFGGAKKLAGKSFNAAVAYVDGVLAEAVHDGPIVPKSLVGTGGTITMAAALLGSGMKDRIGRKARGKDTGGFTRRALSAFIVKLRARRLAPRVAKLVESVPPDRREIMLAGLLVLERLMLRLNVASIRAYQGGLREGLCLSLARRATSAKAKGVESPAVREYAKLVRYEGPHSEQVAAIAVRLFDGLRKLPRFAGELGDVGAVGGMGVRRLLWAASLLHDVGTAVDYASHHRHSRDMILASDLPGFTSRELLLMANVARYHRKDGPPAPGAELAHEHFAKLTPSERRLATALAGVLRVADGLDRSHEQRVSVASVRVAKKKVVEIRVRPAAKELDLTPERRAAERKGDVLEWTLGSRLRVEWK